MKYTHPDQNDPATLGLVNLKTKDFIPLSQDSKKEIPFPKDDGLFLINLESGSSKLLVSIDKVKEFVTPPLRVGIETFNHMIFSKKG